MLDFTRLGKSYGTGLSYFQPDFNEEVERRKFLRRLHDLISQPVVPPRETDYVITQTMAEYLAHVHQPSFDGILFKSVQRAEGTNVVLFAERDEGEQGDRQDKTRCERSFPITYIDKSFELFSTEEIKYKHRQRRLMKQNGEVVVSYEDEYDDLYDGLED
jgi:RES domain-containing protein